MNPTAKVLEESNLYECLEFANAIILQPNNTLYLKSECYKSNKSKGIRFEESKLYEFENGTFREPNPIHLNSNCYGSNQRVQDNRFEELERI